MGMRFWSLGILFFQIFSLHFSVECVSDSIAFYTNKHMQDTNVLYKRIPITFTIYFQSTNIPNRWTATLILIHGVFVVYCTVCSIAIYNASCAESDNTPKCICVNASWNLFFFYLYLHWLLFLLRSVHLKHKHDIPMVMVQYYESKYIRNFQISLPIIGQTQVNQTLNN